MADMQSIRFYAELNGVVNGEGISVQGCGWLVPHRGITSGTYMLRTIPKQFDPKLLAACLITGYPNACAPSPNHENPFGSHAYKYERSLRFREGYRLQLNTDCRYEGDALHSQFNLSGTAPSKALVALSDIDETWTPAGAGEIGGEFSATWHAADGSSISAEALSLYRIHADVALRRPISRHIRVEASSIGEGILLLFQDSQLV